MPSNEDVLKALVDESLGRSDVHPDRRSVLEEWREDNLTDEEKESRLTDEERAERDGATADPSTAQDRRAESDSDSETDRDGPENRPEQDSANTTAPETGKPSTRKAGK